MFIWVLVISGATSDCGRFGDVLELRNRAGKNSKKDIDKHIYSLYNKSKRTTLCIL